MPRAPVLALLVVLDVLAAAAETSWETPGFAVLANSLRYPRIDRRMNAARLAMNKGEKKIAKGRVLRITLEDMYEGVELQGIVRKITDFGAFVDVGSTTDGLLHISNMLPAHRQYIGNELIVTASEGEQVLVEVTEVNLKTRKFNLREVQLEEPSLRKGVARDGNSQLAPPTPTARLRAPPSTGDAVEAVLEEVYRDVVTGDEDVASLERLLRDSAKERQMIQAWSAKMRNKGHWTQVGPGIVKSVTDYGAFVEMGGRDGLLHASDMNGHAISRGKKVLLKAGDKIQVRVSAVDVGSGKIKFSMKPYTPSPEEEEAEARAEAEAQAQAGPLPLPLPLEGRGMVSAGFGSARDRDVANNASGEGEGGGGGGGRSGEAESPAANSAFAAAWERALKEAAATAATAAAAAPESGKQPKPPPKEPSSTRRKEGVREAGEEAGGAGGNGGGEGGSRSEGGGTAHTQMTPKSAGAPREKGASKWAVVRKSVS